MSNASPASSSMSLPCRVGALALLLVAGCTKGQEREFVGPPDVTPVDKTIAQVVVVPRLGTMTLGEQLDLAAFARTNKGDSVGVEVTWSSTGGQVSSNGLFTGDTPGTYWIIARSVTQAEKADSANVVVVGPNNPLTRVDVTPATVGARIGQPKQFSAAVYHQDGALAQVPVFWTASGGSISGQGVYVPDTQGDQLVIAVVGAGLADTALVHVSSTPVLTGIVVTPADDTVDQGDSRQFVVAGSWSDGSNQAPAVDYSTTGGLIDTTGVFIAAAPPGDYIVIAQERGGNRQGTSRVKIRPETVASIVISPSSILLVPGASHLFTATGRSKSGEVLSVPVNWSATGGTVTNSGSYTAGTAAGTFRVIAVLSGGDQADTAFVVISNSTATLTQLVLNPGAATMPAGTSIQFNVAGSWSDGSSATPSVTYTATSGTITASGMYTAPVQTGTHRVIARHAGGTLADTTVVTVIAPRLVSLTISPATATLTAGGTRQFSASVLWSDGGTTVPQLSWTATGGTITAGGQFTAGGASGTYLVVARDQGATVADTAYVTIGSAQPVLLDIAINPAGATLQSGAVQQFYVQGTWTEGGTAVPAVAWSATGGSITGTGRFTAGSAAGTYRVIAVEPASGIADTVVVRVLPPPPVLTGLVVQPDPAVVQAGGVELFTVTGVWTNGGSGAPAVNWSATGGTINSAGVYTAGSAPGTYRVIAHQAGGSLADTAVVSVSSQAPVLVGLRVTPDSSSVATAGVLQFGAAGIWSNGGSGTPAVSWRTLGGGAISASGLFTAGAVPGVYNVIATQVGGSVADTATVFVVTTGSAITMLDVEPGSVSIQPGMTQDFVAGGQWNNGPRARINDADLVWTATGGTISANGHYTAGSVGGDFKVVAQAKAGGVADTADVIVNAPAVIELILSPASATVPAGGTQQFSTTAVWSDGVSRPVAVTYSATGGIVDVTGRYTAGQIAGQFTVVATCSCGAADTSGVTVTSSGGGGAATLTSLRISPSQANLVPSGTIQFTATAQWSNGGTNLPPLSWSATGGTVSSSGSYVAPAANGTYRVIVSHTGGTLKDTATVSVQAVTPPPQGVWVQENFNQYSNSADLMRYPSLIWSGANEDVNTNRISLDPSGPPVGGKSMRYDFPDRSGSSTLCHDYTIGRNIKFPQAVNEVWIDMWVKFDATFETYVPQCDGISANGYKFIFGRCRGGSCGRYEIKVGNQLGRGQTAYAPGLIPPPNWQVIPIPSNKLPYSAIADGQWHRWRQHLKAAPNGGIKVWFDDALVYDSWADSKQANATVDATSIYGISLGRNMNQGPIQPQSLWWGQVQVYRANPGW